MKKRSLLLATLVLLSSSTLCANDTKSNVLSSDSTVQKSDRKAILGMTHLGLGSKHISFPVYYTPSGKNAKTRQIGTWKVRLKQSYVDNVLAKQYPILISNRYDKIILDDANSMVITPTKDTHVNLGSIPKFTFNQGSYQQFGNKVGQYLNTAIASKTQKILSQAKEARFESMDLAHAGSFIQSKAKETGIPVEILDRLMKSSYAFSVYLPPITGSISISQIEHKDSKGRVYYTYSTSMSAPVDTKLIVSKFDGKHYKFYKEINAEAEGFMSAMAKGRSGGASISTDFRPNKSHAQALFNQVFNLSLKDTLIAITTRLKADRTFAIVAPIEDVSWFNVDVKIGIQEDIRVDHPMKVFRTIDGKEKEVGLFKVRSVGKNCALMPAADRTLTKGSMIFGGAEIADLAVEHPWTGVFGTFGYVITPGAYDFSNASATLGEHAHSGRFFRPLTTTGETTMLTLETDADLGYVLNREGLSEIWMNIGFGVGLAPSQGDLPKIILDNVTGTSTTQSGIAMKAMFGFEKRIYPLPLLTVGLGADFGVDLSDYGYNTDDTSNYKYASLLMMNLHVVPRVKVLIQPSINFDIYASAGYNVPLFTAGSYSISDGNEDSEDPSITINGVSRAAGINMAFGLSFHTDFAGSFAKMFALPSKECQRLKARTN